MEFSQKALMAFEVIQINWNQKKCTRSSKYCIAWLELNRETKIVFPTSKISICKHKNRKSSSQQGQQRKLPRKTSSQQGQQRKPLLDLAAARLVKKIANHYMASISYGL